MLKSIAGIYRNGKIELSEAAEGVQDDSRVIVTFLPSDTIELSVRGIDEAQAADLRAHFQTFIEDWESPEMRVYDDYDAAKAKL